MKEEFYFEYSDISEWHWWYIGRKKIILNMLRKYSLTSCENNILDIGCGPGAMIKDFKPYGKTFGVDSNINSVKECRKRGNLGTCISVASKTPFRESTFSVVLLLDILEHLDNDKDAIEEAIRLCKPGGLIIITVPAFQFLWSNQDIISYHKRRYSMKTIKELVKMNTVEKLKFSYFNFFLFPIVVIIRLFQKAIFKDSANRDVEVSDFSLNRPGFLNNFLKGIFSLESNLIKFSYLPIGSSIICVLKKI